jgi:putative ABC transport system permease protein
MLDDVRLALRRLSRSPGYSVIVVATLGLGIGANTAVFSVVDGLLLRPLPYAHPDRLFVFSEQSPQTPSRLPSYPTFRDYTASPALAGAGYILGEAQGLRTSDGVVQLVVGRVSDGFFDMLRPAPLLGRLLTAADEHPGARPAAVLTYGLWRSRFAGDPSVLGRVLTTGDGSFTVVGVLPPGAAYPAWVQLYTPLSAGPRVGAMSRRDVHIDGGMLVRLRSGLDPAQAAAQLATLSRRLAEAYPADNADYRAAITPLRSAVVGGGIRNPLFMLLAATAMVLLIASVNVANLSLARLAARTRELALRTALGADRRRLVIHLLGETVLLAGGGAVLGLALASALVQLLTATNGQGLLAAAATGFGPVAEGIRLDGRVFGAALLVTFGAALAAGLVPAWTGSRIDLAGMLRQGGPGSGGGRGSRRGRSALIGLQTGLALSLLVAAGLLINSFWRVLQVDRGFDSDGLLSAHVFPSPRYAAPDSDIAALYARLIEALQALPGVRSVGMVNHLPMAGAWSGTRVGIDGAAMPPGQDLTVGLRTVNLAYLSTMRIPLLRGRWFTEGEMRPSAGQAVVINRQLAERYWPGQDPLGHRVNFFKSAAGRADFGQPLSGEVVGVVGDVRQFGLDLPSDAAIYLPYPVNPWGHSSLIIRSSGDPAALIEPVRRALLAAEPDLVITDLRPTEQVVAQTLVGRELLLALVAVFAGAALLLAAIGLYGVLSHLVRLREREIGIRRAVGAGPRQIMGMVLRDGMRAVLVGTLLGLVGAWGLARLLASQLFGVTPEDPVTYGLTLGVLLLVALLACYLPARRAARVDPLVALREE